MKRVFSFSSGLILGAIFFGLCGIFVGSHFALSNQPAVVLVNVSSAALPQVEIETDVGESHVISDLPPQKSRRVKFASGRKKDFWITATTPAGKTLTSEKQYVASQGVAFAVITEDSIVIDYELF